GGARREFAVTIPRCGSAVGVLQSATNGFRDFRSSSRGRIEVGSGTVTCALGTIARWQVRWLTGDAPDRSAPPVTARAESVVTAEPHVLNVQTRLICETPELADPFASARLEVILPARSIVTSASGQSLVAWSTRPEAENLRLLLDFASPPIVGQSVDLQ